MTETKDNSQDLPPCMLCGKKPTGPDEDGEVHCEDDLCQLLNCWFTVEEWLKLMSNTDTRTEHQKDEEALERVRKAIHEGRLETRYKNAKENAWSRYARGTDLDNDAIIYRIQPPKPTKKRVPLEMADWAGGPWWVRERNNETDPEQACRVGEFGVKLSCNGDKTHERMFQVWERSTDLINWHPCWKEVGDAD